MLNIFVVRMSPSVLNEISFAAAFQVFFIGVELYIILQFGWKILRKRKAFSDDYEDLGFGAVVGAKTTETVHRLKEARNLGEVPSPYPNAWYVLLNSEELKSSGMLKRSILGLRLVAWRGKLGRVYVGDESSLAALDLESNAANLEKSVADARISLYKTLERNGRVYLWYHTNGSEPSWEPMEQEMFKSEKSSKQLGRRDFIFNGHIRDVGENIVDVAHGRIVHSGDFLFFSRRDKHDKPEFSKQSSQLYEESYFYVFGRHIFTAKIFVTMEGPGMATIKSQLGYFTFFTLFSFVPLGPTRIRLTMENYCMTWSSAIFAPLHLRAFAAEVPKDIPIWNRKTHLRKPILLKEEGAIGAFRHWFDQFYSEYTPDFCDEMRER